MQTVFTNDQTVHIWAQQNQAEGRNANRSIFFEGDTIYSYGTHFPMARFTALPDGSEVVLITNQSYSITTSQHVSRVRQAVNNFPRVYFSDPRNTPKQELALIKIQLAEKLKAIPSGISKTTRGKLFGEALSIIDKHAEIASLFGVKGRLSIPAKLEKYRADYEAKELADASRREKQDATNATKRARQRARWEEERRLDALELPAKIEAWISGANPRLPYGIDTLLRVKEDTVETSRGASFPRSHARLGLALVRRTVASGQPWQSNGHTCHLGHYKIDRIEANGTVRAGCHVVTLEAIERIASQL